jgi:microcin C transport system permease protein
VLLAPFFVLFAVFGLFPLLFSVLLAFQTWEPTAGLASMEFAGLGNFAFALHDEWFWKSLGNTLWLALASGVPQHLVAVPLGVAKAVREGSRFDGVTSMLVLIGYSIPGFVLGVFLLVVFAGSSFVQWFPLRGLTSDDWETLSWFGKVKDYLWHITLPVLASVAGSFAVMTMLTKNTFLEEIRKQYVLTARAKGLSERAVLYKHVFRNALIPLVTGFPAAFIGAFFAGSLLIETLFSLDGLGLLSYESVVRRDYPVVLGTLYLFTLIGLVVKLLGDLCYVWADPRVQFESLAR